MLFTQAGLWFQCAIAVLLVTKHDTYDDIWLDVETLKLVSPVLIVVWATVLLPAMLEMFALPPYLRKEEEHHVKEVLDLFPLGMCPEDAELLSPDKQGLQRRIASPVRVLPLRVRPLPVLRPPAPLPAQIHTMIARQPRTIITV